AGERRRWPADPPAPRPSSVARRWRRSERSLTPRRRRDPSPDRWDDGHPQRLPASHGISRRRLSRYRTGAPVSILMLAWNGIVKTWAISLGAAGNRPPSGVLVWRRLPRDLPITLQAGLPAPPGRYRIVTPPAAAPNSPDTPPPARILEHNQILRV